MCFEEKIFKKVHLKIKVNELELAKMMPRARWQLSLKSMKCTDFKNIYRTQKPKSRGTLREQLGKIWILTFLKSEQPFYKLMKKVLQTKCLQWTPTIITIKFKPIWFYNLHEGHTHRINWGKVLFYLINEEPLNKLNQNKTVKTNRLH